MRIHYSVFSVIFSYNLLVGLEQLKFLFSLHTRLDSHSKKTVLKNTSRRVSRSYGQLQIIILFYVEDRLAQRLMDLLADRIWSVLFFAEIQ